MKKEELTFQEKTHYNNFFANNNIKRLAVLPVSLFDIGGHFNG